MKTILVAPRGELEIEFQLGQCMACLENAGIRDYTSSLQRYAVFHVADAMFADAVEALLGDGFEIEIGLATKELMPAALIAKA